MARLRVAGGGDGLQIWREALNVLNKQSRTVDKGWSSSLGLGEVLTNPHRKKVFFFYEMLVTQGLRIGRILWNDVGNRECIWDLEHGMLGVCIGQVQ
jgi:hypothetical protein